MAYMGQCDYVSISLVHIPKVRNDSEDLGRNLVDRCRHVSPNTNQVEDLESVSLENVDLERVARQLQSMRPFRWVI